MLTASVKIKVLAFVVVSVVGIAYLGVNYVGINPFSSGYRVAASLPKTGGIFEGAEVTYRGVPVGEVAALHPTEDGVEAVLAIDADAPPMPENVQVTVNNRSVIGMQYINLRGGSLAGPKLSAGDHLRVGRQALPPGIADVIRTSRELFESVPSKALNTVIEEGYELTRGLSDPVHRLLQTSLEFARTANTNFLVTAELIRNSERVLRTQQASADSIRSFSRDLKVLAASIADSDQQWRQLIRSTPGAAREVGLLFDEVGEPLGALMTNLVTTAQIFAVNAAGVEGALIRLPKAISIGWAVTGSKGIQMGLAQTYFDPLPCTQGYQGTEMRPGLATSKGEPFNLDAGCTMPTSSGTNVRGPMAVPDKIAQPGPRARVGMADTLADLMGGSS